MNLQIAQIIETNKERLSEKSLSFLYSLNPSLKTKYQGVEERLKLDISYHLDFIAAAIRYESIPLLVEYAHWNRVFFEELKIHINEIVQTYQAINDAITSFVENSEEAQKILNPYFATIYQHLKTSEVGADSFIKPENPHYQLAVDYFNLVMNQEKAKALSLIINAVDSGVSIKDIYLNVFQPCLREVGRLWQTNQITVAQEHYFTGITQLIIAQLYPRLFTGKHSDKHLVAACVGDELHEIGIRMVADLYELKGWNSIYLGARTPISSIIDTVEKVRPQILALSATLTPHVEEIEIMISKLRDQKGLDFTRILVGGYPFNVDPNLWKKVGADGYAPDAEGALFYADQPFFYRVGN